MPETGILDAISFVGDVAALVLAVVAIWLALYFYKQGKGTELAVSNSLTKIETQTDVLNNVTMRQLDRLTKYVTQSRKLGEDESLTKFIESVRGLAEAASKPSAGDQGTTPELESSALEKTLWIAVQFYAGQANYWSQGYIPDASQFDPNNPNHQLAKHIVDLSHADFIIASQKVRELKPHDVDATGLRHMYDETNRTLTKYVVPSSYVYEQRARG
ncbi:MAG: hypothetical protein ABIE70_03755 [bacterium]